MPFRNPYHFVPVTENIPHCIDSPVDKKLGHEELGHRTFDRYHKDTLSGRLICTIETMGPVVIGKNQESNADGEQYTRVHPFKRKEKPAIPASSIRGCISAIAEAASNSALRVLDNTPYSRRTSMKDDVENHVEDYSAIGMIVDVNGELRLRPLAMPTLLNAQLPSKYSIMFPNDRKKAFCYMRDTLSDALPTYDSNGDLIYYYAKLGGDYTKKDGRILLGIHTIGDPVLQPPDDPVTHLPDTSYTRGILRVIYKQNRDGDMPTGKKHEIFIPYSTSMESDPTFPIEDEALERFYRLASARNSENNRRQGTTLDPLPYALKGGQPFPNREYRLKDKDIVFFVPDSTGERVVKVWVSQLWREEIPSRPYDFFKAVNRELLPYHKGRETITPAEALFGFVEVNENGEEVKAPRALASRIRFSEGKFTGCSENEWYHEEIPLRILASPKPPCPPFYFRNRKLPDQVTANDCYISKKQLDPNSHRPQGRKFYFNHDTNQNLVQKAKTRYPDENQAQKNKVKPLKKGCRFMFRLDFDNLSEWELGLLLYALRPSDDFYHKIGMAKPLGFGTIKTEPAALFLVDRQARYSADGFADMQRYTTCWFRQSVLELVEELDIHEQAALNGESISDEDSHAPVQLKSIFIKDLQEPIRKALAKIGQPDVRNISPPLALKQGNESEKETFKWFQNNDNAKQEKRQGLVPLEYGDETGITGLREN